MKWGVRKDYSHVKELHRITKTPDETNIPDGYYTTSAKEARSFNEFIQNNNIPGVKVFNMNVLLKDVIITPSQKEEVEIQLELLKDKKIKDLWAESLADKKMSSFTMAQRHDRLSEFEGFEEYWQSEESKKDWGAKRDEKYAQYKKEYDELKKEYNIDRKQMKKEAIDSIEKSTNDESLLYFSMAVFGSPKLRKIYREILIDKGYNAVEDHWGQNEKNGTKKLSSPSAVMILDKRIFKTVNVK